MSATSTKGESDAVVMRRRVPRSTLIAAAALLGLVVYIAVQILRPSPALTSTFPQSVDMERATGVDFTRVAVVGDGGLVLVEYVVVDVDRATAFQTDRAHVPSLSSEVRAGGTRTVSIMKPGHLIRAGQTYYFVYHDDGGAIRAGEPITIRYLDHVLTDVPVQ